MTKSKLAHLFFSLVIIILSLTLADFFNFYMPMGLHILLIIFALVIFLVFAKSILDKISLDEREQQLELFSYKGAFLATIIALIITISYQSFFNHKVDFALVYILSFALLTKIIISFIKK